MGRTVTPSHYVEFTMDGSTGLTPICWNSRRVGQVPGYGRPNSQNLAKLVASYNASFLPGGANEHCGPLKIRGARLVLNDGTRRVVATV